MLTKPLGIALLLAVAAAVANAEPCAYQLCKKTKDGPEITGNYARPYLYSSATGCWYPDPMYYVAKDALRRWHARRSCVSSPSESWQGKGKTYRPTVEK